MSSDVFNYCSVCRVNHSHKHKHIFTKKHKQKLNDILQKYGQKIKECRPYLNDPVIQEGSFEPERKFWCHCCAETVLKHVTDFLKTILYGGVIEHLASEKHWTNTEAFWKEHGADPKFKTLFIVSQIDICLFKSKLEPLVDVFDSRKNKQTKIIAKQIESQEISRKLITTGIKVGESSSNSSAPITYKTVKNQHGILQNPTGYHDNVRVWRGGIVKYKENSDQLQPCLYTSRKGTERMSFPVKRKHTLAAESGELTSVSIAFDTRKGNIHTGALPPWLQPHEQPSESTISSSSREYGPSEQDLKNYLKAKEMKKLNPNRVGANFDHTVHSSNKETDWLPSFGRVWNHGARWKSRHQYRDEAAPESSSSKKFKKKE